MKENKYMFNVSTVFMDNKSMSQKAYYMAALYGLAHIMSTHHLPGSTALRDSVAQTFFVLAFFVAILWFPNTTSFNEVVLGNLPVNSSFRHIRF